MAGPLPQRQGAKLGFCNPTSRRWIRSRSLTSLSCGRSALDEAIWFDRSFMPVVCPVFYVETLGDLGKESSRLARPRTPS